MPLEPFNSSPTVWVFFCHKQVKYNMWPFVSAVWPVVWVWSVPVAFRWECACHSKLSSGTTHSVWSADPCFTCEINTLPFKARSASYSTRSLLIYRNFLKLSLKGSWEKKTEKEEKAREEREKKEETSTERVINSETPLTDSELTRSARCRPVKALTRMSELNEHACKWGAGMHLNRNQFELEFCIRKWDLGWSLQCQKKWITVS